MPLEGLITGHSNPKANYHQSNHTGNTTVNRRVAVRESGVSCTHRGPIKVLLNRLRPSQLYRIEGIKGAPNWAPIRQMSLSRWVKQAVTETLIETSFDTNFLFAVILSNFLFAIIAGCNESIQTKS